MPETNIYDYEFTVNESEPKRAEMLNRLKDRVKHVDKKEVISSDEYVEGETNFSEDKALSAFLLYKLFPTKVNLLKEHYTKNQVDGLLGDLITKYYLKDQIDLLLANLKNELKSSFDTTGDSLKQLVNSLKSDLSKHRTLEELDHPDASVTTRKLRDHSVTKEKLSDGLTNELNAKLNKNGDTITGPLKFAYNNPILFETGPGTGKYHRIGSGSTLEEIGRGEAHLDLGDYDGNTYETNLCCVNRPGWYNATTKEVKKFALQEEIDALNNRVNNLPRGGGSTTFAKISANKIWSGRVYARGIHGRTLNKIKVCDLPSDWEQVIIYSTVEQSTLNENVNTNCFAILVKGQKTDVVATKDFANIPKIFVIENNILYLRGISPNGDDISVYKL
uniref:Uncharacterized protein n=1 Tax=Myoviridae sp. ctJ2i1 TaxID=2825079 RepID=A0A8S5V1I2_9CAUD|nr:MAG TPA: hypothetical protein [Myoviridae sp. ctJ2i1]